MVGQDGSADLLNKPNELSAAKEQRIEAANKKRILAFKVSHILVSLLLIWFL